MMEVLPMEESTIPNWICSLEEELGSLIWVSLRDDTFYVGIFKTFDQYGNVVLSDAIQKIVVPEKRIFSDLYNGNLVIRGESIAYFCAVDITRYINNFCYNPTPKSLTDTATYNFVPLEEALKLAEEYKKETKTIEWLEM